MLTRRHVVTSLRVLGSGSSSSTPTIRCVKSSTGPCPRCLDAIQNPSTSKNRRNNPSILLTTTSLSPSIPNCVNNVSDNSSTDIARSDDFSILVDLGKTFRDSVLRLGCEGWRSLPPVKAVMLSHFHADAMNSLDDIREFSVGAVPCFCDHITAEHVRRRDPHLCCQDLADATNRSRQTTSAEGQEQRQRRYVGALDVHPVKISARGVLPVPLSSSSSSPSSSSQPGDVRFGVDVLGLPVDFCPLYHGRDCTAAGFIFPTANGKRVAYFSDIGRICPELDRQVVDACRGCDVLFLDCIGSSNTYVAGAHFILAETVAAAKLIQPKALRLVGMGHTDDHDELSEKLQKQLQGESFANDAECAYDGMLLKF